MPDRSENNYGLEARLPPEMALKAEQAGAAKAGRDAVSLLVLSILAGAFIAFGAIFMTVVMTGSAGALPFGVARLLGGLVFSLGLILVVIGGAELFTGDNLMVMAWANRGIKTRSLLRAWVIIYLGNLIGAVGTAGLIFLSGQSGLAGGGVGKTALAIAAGKAELPFFDALVLGILCNVLVCLAVWSSYSARTVVGKIFAIVPPVSAFVAAGFEHSIANMYFFPVALMIKEWAPEPFWKAIGAAPKDYPEITVMAAVGNIAPVTIGNIIGGGVLVGAVYWFVYLRKR